MLGKRKSKSTGKNWGFFYIPGTTRDSGIFVTDEKEYIFSAFFKVLADEKGFRPPPLMLKHPDEAMNEYIRNYDLVAVLRDPEGNKICYSVNYLNKLPSEFTNRLRTYLQLMPDDTVLWSDSVSTDPQEAPARQVIYGQRPEKPPKRTKADVRKHWAHPAELKPEEMDYLSGKTKEPPPE